MGNQHTQMVRVKTVHIGRSGSVEYAEYNQAQRKEFKAITVGILQQKFMPTDNDFVEIFLSSSFACHYWRTDLNFIGAVEQVVQDIQRSMGVDY
jgi:hypothetical protein